MIENLLAATHILVIKHNLGALYFNVSFYRIRKGGKINFSLKMIFFFLFSIHCKKNDPLHKDGKYI